MDHLALDDLLRAFRDAGATRVFVKRLAANDNSKQQVYLGGGFAILNELPLVNFRPMPSHKGRAIIHADLPLCWLLDDGTTSKAPHSKVVLYPQYPEVRWSGFLKGATGAPVERINEHARVAGRILILGVRPDRTVLARVHEWESPVARELDARGTFSAGELLVELHLEDPRDERDKLLDALRKVAAKGWLSPVRLQRDGTMVPCGGPNCGGVTLESWLGITPNSRAEPDLLGWEIKQFGVRDFVKFRAVSPVTVFTPEPTEGVYATDGVETFIRKWGYPDTKGRPGRLNIGGRFTVGKRLGLTGLTLDLEGVGSGGDTITDPQGGIILRDDQGTIAAKWPFPAMLEHWNRKHANAAYVPSLRQDDPRKYRYSPDIYLASGTDFGLFLGGLSKGIVCYDPGIKLEGLDGPRVKIKRRSQFRVAFPELVTLYRAFEAVLGG